jgi:chemotaxis family two-component system response regulator Rcp1
VSHIVLIDDSPSDVYLTKLALEESGLQFEMTTFHSGADALRALCPSGGAVSDPLIPDLILLDLNTPCSDGFEVLGRIRGNPGLSHVPVAIITSSNSTADQHRAALGGATTYIKKPTQLKAFIDSVSSAVKQLLADTRA